MRRRVRHMSSQTQRLFPLARRGSSALGLLTFVVFLWWFLYWYVNPDDPSERTGMAQLVATIVAGVLLLIGVYQTQNRDRLGEQGQITDRFTKAIEQLGSEKLAVRLGGIYALERIARDSERDHWPILEVLTAFIREGSPRRANGDDKPVPEDMKAAVAVVGRLASCDEPEEDRRIDLENTNLPGIQLSSARLRNVSFSWGVLDGAVLQLADMRGAWFVGTRLEGTNLVATNLQGAHLEQAVLDGAEASNAVLARADLRDASLKGVGLHGAHLSHAYLRKADLSDALLSRAVVKDAYIEAANLKGANLSDANAEGAYFGDAVLDRADLAGCNLKGANLHSASLIGARLRGARLRGTRLRGAQLSLADLKAADLSGADLRGACLQGADLDGVLGLTWEQVEQAHIDDDTRLPDYLQRSADSV